MQEQTIDQATKDRQQRGIALYRDHSDRIARVYAHTWEVPSCGGGRSYIVQLAPRVRCTCPDFEQRRLPCKHAAAATIAQAKRRAA